MKFLDQAKIYLKSGDGGPGIVAALGIQGITMLLPLAPLRLAPMP